MADEILNCDGTEPVHIPEWVNVVGASTIEDGGYIGDILKLSISHIDIAFEEGRLTAEEAGNVYSTAIVQSVSEAIRFELQEGKAQLELCYLQAQIDKLICDCENDRCRAEAECALKAAQTIKVEEETLLVTEKIKSEVKHNEIDGIYDQQIYKMIEDVKIAKEELLIAKSKENREYTGMIAEIDKIMGYDYTLDVDGYIVRDSLVDAGDGKLDAEVCVLEAECDLVKQKVLTEVENTALVVEKIESEDKHNQDDGIYDNQINKMIEDVQIAKEELLIAKSKENREYTEMISDIDKVMGYDYTLDSDGYIVKGSLVDAGDGKLDAEVCVLESECDLVKQKVLTETENTLLVTEKIESEDKNNMVDGMIDKQILKTIEETLLVTEKIESEDYNNMADGIMENSILKLKEEIKFAESKLATEQAMAQAKLDKEMGYEVTTDANGNIILGVSSGEGKIDADICISEKTCELTTQKILTEVENTALFVEKIETEDVQNRVDGVMENQILKIVEDIEIAKAELALSRSTTIANIDKGMGYNYTEDGDGNIIIGDSHGTGKLDAEIEKIFAEKDLVIEQDDEIPKESARRDCTTTSQCAVNDAQVSKLECDCTNDTNMTDSKISLNAAQENKLACECCNDSKKTEGQLVKWECDCANSAKVTSAQAELYERQISGFNDNANQKIYDTQMNAWAMVFADQEDLGILDPTINQTNIGISFDRIQNRLTAAANKEEEESEE